MATIVVFVGIGLLLGMNKSLGEEWLRAAPYIAFVLAPLPALAFLWVLALVLDRVLDVILDLLLPPQRSRTKERR